MNQHEQFLVSRATPKKVAMITSFFNNHQINFKINFTLIKILQCIKN